MSHLPKPRLQHQLHLEQTLVLLVPLFLSLAWQIFSLFYSESQTLDYAPLVSLASITGLPCHCLPLLQLFQCYFLVTVLQCQTLPLPGGLDLFSAQSLYGVIPCLCCFSADRSGNSLTEYSLLIGCCLIPHWAAVYPSTHPSIFPAGWKPYLAYCCHLLFALGNAPPYRFLWSANSVEQRSNNLSDYRLGPIWWNITKVTNITTVMWTKLDHSNLLRCLKHRENVIGSTLVRRGLL